jgi:DHA1 family multidrug resistance protein-like MFS transporter
MFSLPAETWRRNQHVMAATVFVVFTGFAFVLPFLPLFVRELGIADDEDVALWAGLLILVSPLLAGVLAPAWGRHADRHGQKRTALRALGAYVVLLALSACVRDVWQLLLLRVGVGLFGGIGPLGLAMATAGAPREHTGKAVGLIQAAQILAAAVGPLLGGSLADTIGIRATFLVAAALCAVPLGLVAIGYHEPARTPGLTAAAGLRFGELFRLPRVAQVLGVLFLVNFIGRSFTPILPLYLARLGVQEARLSFSTGLLISVYSVAAALSAAGFGHLTRRYPPRRLLVLSLLGGAATVLPMAHAGSFPALLGLAVLLGLASGGALTLCYTIGGLLIEPAIRTAAFGFFSAAALFGGSASPLVAGLLARFDLRGIFLVDALLFVLVALALLPGRYPEARSG